VGADESEPGPAAAAAAVVNKDLTVVLSRDYGLSKGPKATRPAVSISWRVMHTAAPSITMV
jgi:hypothetical protein